MPIRRADILLLLLVLAAALGLRLWGFGWGLPGPSGEMTPIERAWEFWNWGTDEGLDFNPHDFGWPSLIFYLAFLEQCLFYLWGSVTGSLSSLADLRVLYEIDPSPLILWGRAFSTAAELGSIAVVFLLGRALFGRAAGAAAALVIAVDPHHVAWSQNQGPEVWVCLFVLLGSLALLRVAESGRVRDYALLGIWVGLGTAAKYTPVLLLAPLPLAHLMAPAERRMGGRRAALARFLKRPVVTLVLAGTTFFLASPYVLLDTEESLFYSLSQFRRLATVSHFGQESVGPGWLFYLRDSLPESLGVVLLSLGIAGMVGSLITRRRREILILVFPLLYFLLLGAGTSKYDHYMLPVTPFLAIIGTGWLWRMFGDTSPRKIVQAIPVAVVAVGLVFPAVGVVKRHRKLALPDTRHISLRWVEENVPAGSLILAEFSGPRLLTAARIRYVSDGPLYRDISSRLLPELRKRPAYPVATLPLFTQEPTESAVFYEPGLYDGFEYCITSSEIAGRYRRDTVRFSRQVSFYRWLEEMAQPLKTFVVPGGPGPEIRVYSLRGAVESYRAVGGGSPRRAWEEVRRYARRRAPRAGEFALKMGQAYEAKELLTQAAAAYAVAAESVPDDPETHYALAGVLALLGRSDSARSEYEKVLALNPQHVGALNNLGALELREGRATQARRFFERALSLDPELPDAHVNLGAVLLLEGGGEAARAHFEKALELAPHHPRAGDIRRVLEGLRRPPE